jgi:hypothetical protein
MYERVESPILKRNLEGKMEVRIDQLEAELAQKLVSPLKNTFPGQYQLRVSLLDSSGRKKRSNASSINWSPASGRIEIRFEPTSEQEKIMSSEIASGADSKSHPQPDKIPEGFSAPNTLVVPLEIEIKLLRSLHRAESTPGWNFVSLKKFRDEILPHEPVAPGSFQPTDIHWQEAIRRAIEKRWILTGKVQNPKSPQFPVTSIRLNRLMPEVQKILGQPKSNLDFRPIHIKGEPLSATILRERR